METHHAKSSEVFIPVLEHGRLHLGSCRASVLKILIKIAISHGPNLGHKTWSALETHREKSSEVFSPVVEHGRLHLGSCRASVLKILIKIAISHAPHQGHKTWSVLETHHQKSSEIIIPVLDHT